MSPLPEPPSGPALDICIFITICSIGPPGTKRVMVKTSIVIPRKVGIKSSRRRRKYADMGRGPGWDCSGERYSPPACSA